MLHSGLFSGCKKILIGQHFLVTFICLLTLVLLKTLPTVLAEKQLHSVNNITDQWQGDVKQATSQHKSYHTHGYSNDGTGGQRFACRRTCQNRVWYNNNNNGETSDKGPPKKKTIPIKDISQDFKSLRRG